MANAPAQRRGAGLPLTSDTATEPKITAVPPSAAVDGSATGYKCLYGVQLE
jgi:hypothetical protein